MLIFIDDSRQTILGKAGDGHRMRRASARRLQQVLPRRVSDQEGRSSAHNNSSIRNSRASPTLPKAAFLRRDCEGDAPHLRAVDRLLGLLEDHHATWMISVSSFDAASLRTRDDLMFPEPYRALTWRLLKFAKSQVASGDWDGISSITLDQVGHKEDQRAGAAFQNYFTRHALRYQLAKYFIQVPSFTHSTLSPGIQTADLLAYLACQQLDSSESSRATAVLGTIHIHAVPLQRERRY